MYDITSFALSFDPNPQLSEFSEWFNFSDTQQINLLPFDHNVIIKKFQITCTGFLNPRDQVINQWQTRLRLYNRDGRLIQGIRGNQLNPTAAPFSDANNLQSNVPLIFSDRETIKEFPDGIYACGFQFRSVAGLIIGNTTTISPLRLQINVYTEKHAV